MRIGSNPKKINPEKINYKQHRVIMPVYIPDSSEPFYNNLFEVFRLSVLSLLNTLNPKFTAITIINNNSKPEVHDFVFELLQQGKIDKYVINKENLGKINPILAEARASYEDFITISDADVFFFPGWEKAVFEIFNAFPRAGVVSPLPMPHLAHYCNASFLVNNLFSLKKGKIIQERDLKLFEKGISNPTIFTNKRNLYKEHYYLAIHNFKSIVGAGHFVATYRNRLIQKIPFQRPVFVFKNGDEYNYLDKYFDIFGYYRLSTVKSYVYHLGNTIPDWIRQKQFSTIDSSPFTIPQPVKIRIQPYWIYKLKSLIFKVLRKTKLI